MKSDFSLNQLSNIGCMSIVCDKLNTVKVNDLFILKFGLNSVDRFVGLLKWIINLCIKTKGVFTPGKSLGPLVWSGPNS